MKYFGPQHRDNLSKSAMGNTNALGMTPWNKGITIPENKKHYGNKNRLGQIQSLATRVKISESKTGKKWSGFYHLGVAFLRSSYQWKKWRKSVFERDNYTCRKCGAKSGQNHDGSIYLEAHHPTKVKDLFNTPFEKYIFNPDNGITLCKPCHLNITYA